MGCAGGAPLLHPAHTLGQGQTRFAAGSSANFVLGDASDAVEQARSTPVSSPSDVPTESYARGALSLVSLAPGVSPFASGRVGMLHNTEAGISYLGRAIRVDGRYAFSGETLALSIGAGGSALLQGREYDSALSGLDVGSLTGWGLDIPVILGGRSEPDLLWWWTGVRGGYEKLGGQLSVVTQRSPDPTQILANTTDIDGTRTYGSAILGIAIGFRHLHGAIEVQGGYQHGEGTLWNHEVSFDGVSLTSAAALLGTF